MLWVAAVPPELGLFEGFGVETEYVIVDATTKDVVSAADDFLRDGAGEIAQTKPAGTLEWSNELALHVIELKNPRPVPELSSLIEPWHAATKAASATLRTQGRLLMPGAMHPWMEARSESQLWPHGDRAIYDAYDRIFDCRRPGYANLQSVHLNLPFSGDDEFARLHTAARLVLPLIPAICAASPFAEGKHHGRLDERLEVYRGNSARFPQITGRVIPEAVLSAAQYEAEILQPMYGAIAPVDPEGLLQHEWLNSRGAIARFDRSAIEIRVIDAQECPNSDFACLEMIVAVLKALVDETLAPFAKQRTASTDSLALILHRVVEQGEQARLDDLSYLRLLGLPARPASARAVWEHLCQVCRPRLSGDLEQAAATILEQGPLGRRLLKAAGREPTREALRAVADRLCECLELNEQFVP